MIRHYVAALRLSSLPLSISGVVVGSLLAFGGGTFSWPVFLFTILTALSLHILSNVSNDLGDSQKGIDNRESLGSASALQLGRLTERDYYNMIKFFVVLCVVSGTLLVYFAFGSLFEPRSLLFIVIGAIAMVAAVKYTMGDNNYGYKGWGDLSVFIFFGLLSTVGGYYLQTGTMTLSLLLPAAAIGFLIVGVLNVNNMRDIIGDKICGKNTIPVRIGMRSAKLYHYALIVTAWILLMVYTYLHSNFVWNWLYIALLPLYIRHIARVRRREGKSLERELEELCIAIIVLALVFGVSQLPHQF